MLSTYVIDKRYNSTTIIYQQASKGDKPHNATTVIMACCSAEKCGRISLYVTDDAIAKLYV